MTSDPGALWCLPFLTRELGRPPAYAYFSGFDENTKRDNEDEGLHTVSVKLMSAVTLRLFLEWF